MQKLTLKATEFLPGDEVLYLGRLYVLAVPEPHERYTAVAVEGVDGPPIITHFDAGDRRYSVERPDETPDGMTMQDARDGEAAWLQANLNYAAAKS